MISPKVATYQNVRRRRRRTRRWMPPREESASVTKPVSGACHCLDELGWIVVVDLSPQSPNQHFQHVGEGVVVLIPNVGGDRRAIHYLSLVQDEKLQQREFLGSQLDGLAGTPHPLRIQIDLEVGNAECFRQGSATSSSQRPHPRQQLTEGKGLGEIVIRADLQSRHPVVDCIARSEHEDGGGDLADSQLAAEIEAISAGQHHVEYQHVEAAERRFHFPFGVAGHRHHLNAVLGKAGLYNRRQARVVLDKKNSHKRQFTPAGAERSPYDPKRVQCNDDDSFPQYHSPDNRRKFPAPERAASPNQLEECPCSKSSPWQWQSPLPRASLARRPPAP